ncbi:hypothetical protein ACHAXM_009833 [Skeletonema potamos]
MGLFPFRRSNKKSTSATKKKQPPSKTKKKVHFNDIKPIFHTYEFDWALEGEYWFSQAELKTFNEVRFDEADVLRKERGIRTISRNDADAIEEEEDRNHFIGDALTHALDDDNDEHEISLRGIEHFVWPVLQKEMVTRKKQLKKVVIEWRLPVNRRKDPDGLKLAEESAKLSQWARDVASERGVKYCEMKRGGVLLKNSKIMAKSMRKVVKQGFSYKDMGSRNAIYGIGK